MDLARNMAREVTIKEVEGEKAARAISFRRVAERGKCKVQLAMRRRGLEPVFLLEELFSLHLGDSFQFIRFAFDSIRFLLLNNG